MSIHRSRSFRLFTVPAGLLAAILALASPALGQTLAVPAQPGSVDLAVPARPASLTQEVSAKATGGGEHEGIKVHGHWKIVVKNPDGTVAHTTEFENSLFAGGGTGVLPGLLSQQAVIGAWAISLFPSSSTLPSACGGPSCYLVVSTTNPPTMATCSAVGAVCFGGLSISVNGAAFQLAGQFTASQSATISSVQTNAYLCINGTPDIYSPVTCSTTANLTSFPFTGVSSPAFTAVGVTAGQIVQVTVSITFS